MIVAADGIYAGQQKNTHLGATSSRIGYQAMRAGARRTAWPTRRLPMAMPNPLNRTIFRAPAIRFRDSTRCWRGSEADSFDGGAVGERISAVSMGTELGRGDLAAPCLNARGLKCEGLGGGVAFGEGVLEEFGTIFGSPRVRATLIKRGGNRRPLGLGGSAPAASRRRMMGVCCRATAGGGDAGHLCKGASMTSSELG